MLRMLFFLFVYLLVGIPHTSVQDGSIPIENPSHQQSRRALSSNNVDAIEYLLLTLTEQQYQYETAYYALALNNVLPNFAKMFHERSEQKYDDIRGLIRLGQVLNLDINLKPISSNRVKQPLRLLSPDRINKTNFVEFFSDLKSYECDTTLRQLSNAYQQKLNMSVPLQMYLKKKLYAKQMITCKLTSDVFVQLDRFLDRNSNENSIPFSFMFADARAKIMLSK